jgi:hypothetical protein
MRGKEEGQEKQQRGREEAKQEEGAVGEANQGAAAAEPCSGAMQTRLLGGPG